MESDIPNGPLDLLSDLPEETDEPLFVYVRLPIDIDPVERGQRFGDPLDIALRRFAYGEVTGGGSLLSAPDEDGNRTVEYCGVDVDLVHPRAGIDLLIKELRTLDAPPGTVLEFRVAGQDVELGIYQDSN